MISHPWDPPETQFFGTPCTRERFLVLDDIARERNRQNELFPDQDWTNGRTYDTDRDRLRRLRHTLQNVGVPVTWRLILAEEVAEVLCELDNDERLEQELIQVAAVAVAWIEKIRERRNG